VYKFLITKLGPILSDCVAKVNQLSYKDKLGAMEQSTDLYKLCVLKNSLHKYINLIWTSIFRQLVYQTDLVYMALTKSKLCSSHKLYREDLNSVSNGLVQGPLSSKFAYYF
jgi:hypothetical protein